MYNTHIQNNTDTSKRKTFLSRADWERKSFGLNNLWFLFSWLSSSLHRSSLPFSFSSASICLTFSSSLSALPHFSHKLQSREEKGLVPSYAGKSVYCSTIVGSSRKVLSFHFLSFGAGQKETRESCPECPKKKKVQKGGLLLNVLSHKNMFQQKVILFSYLLWRLTRPWCLTSPWMGCRCLRRRGGRARWQRDPGRIFKVTYYFPFTNIWEIAVSSGENA